MVGGGGGAAKFGPKVTAKGGTKNDGVVDLVPNRAFDGVVQERGHHRVVEVRGRP